MPFDEIIADKKSLRQKHRDARRKYYIASAGLAQAQFAIHQAERDKELAKFDMEEAEYEYREP